MEISVRHTNLKPSLIRTLLSNGILLVSHLNTFDVKRLATKTKLPIDECDKILAATKPKRPHFVIKASDLLIKPFEKITTLKQGLDAILGGGIKCGQVTEISGEAGAGKSNLCSEIGTMVMLPCDKGGKDSKVMYIHTEGQGKLKLALKRFSTLVSSVVPEHDDIINNKLLVKNCFNENELIEIVSRLPEILVSSPEVKLIIIDSITCAFIQVDRKPDYEYYARRDIKLINLVKTLISVAWEKRLAVVITNHVSFDVKEGQNKPALGKVWSHMCQSKIYIERINHNNKIYRYAHVNKGAVLSPQPIEFQITNNLL